MKTALWILGSLLAADALFLSYFYLIRADYYFPGRYEDAFAATIIALPIGMLLLISFVLLLFIARARRLKREQPHGDSAR